jgi:hypothetical protein
MRRANRHSMPDYVWHITHRCPIPYGSDFTLKKRRLRAQNTYSWKDIA